MSQKDSVSQRIALIIRFIRKYLRYRASGKRRVRHGPVDLLVYQRAPCTPPEYRRLRLLAGLADSDSPGTRAEIDAAIAPLIKTLIKRGFLPTWSCSGLLQDHCPASLLSLLHFVRGSLEIKPHIFLQCPEKIDERDFVRAAQEAGFSVELKPGCGALSPSGDIVAAALTPTYNQYHVEFAGSGEWQRLTAWKRLLKGLNRKNGGPV